MWKRAASLILRHHRSAPGPRSPAVSAAAASGLRRTPAPLFFSTLDAAGARTRVEDVMPIATGLEREEIEAELQGKKRFDMDAPVGPFGTKDAPAVIRSYYNKRIVGCPGGEGEDEHDVVWFWLEKDKPHECPVCTQYFMLHVIGEGGSPDGHDDDDHHHH
ncbi:cytochrome c oxidase subunit 5b-1, mitochondrial-like [Phragmites australis]|uniref:cytochrome c oxidase subunit 5b-1, mitochondrial-like n=1 Tax=Phragmites australis TaxID=29695 RepID=UPI002D784557|nr:cytochrome c oxidase subunit 5b-1, mitochondrial-like [Phragmites australis]